MRRGGTGWGSCGFVLRDGDEEGQKRLEWTQQVRNFEREGAVGDLNLIPVSSELSIGQIFQP